MYNKRVVFENIILENESNDENNNIGWDKGRRAGKRIDYTKVGLIYSGNVMNSAGRWRTMLISKRKHRNGWKSIRTTSIVKNILHRSRKVAFPILRVEK